MESQATLRRWMIVCLVVWLLVCGLALIWYLVLARAIDRANQESSFRQTARNLAWIVSRSSAEQIDGGLLEELQKDFGVEASLKRNVSADLLRNLDSSISEGRDFLLEQGPVVWQAQSGGPYRVSVDVIFGSSKSELNSLRLSKDVNQRTFSTWGLVVPWLLLTATGVGLLFYTLGVPNRRTIELCDQLSEWGESNVQQLAKGPRELNAPISLKLPDSFLDLQDLMLRYSDASREKILHLYQEVFRTTRVLNSMVEGVVAVDRQMRILAANPAARELLSMSAEPTPGRSLVELVRFPRLSSMLEQALTSQKTMEGDVEVGSANRRYLRIRLLPLPGEKEPVGVLITLSDETRLKRLENLRREFIANVSHELKTPLAAIKAYAETLLLGALEDEKKNVQFVERISQQADRLDHLIRDMLQLARVQSGNLQMSRVEFAVGKVLASTVESHRVIGESKGVMVRLDEVAPELMVVGDYEAFQTIANNLIGNAVRYTEAGGEVVVSAVEEDGFVCVAVRDTGIGIPEEDQERVFERFYRVEKARSAERGGTGLGLAIVKHLVGAMRGTVKLKSKLGEGSLFEVRLPSAAKKFEGQ